MFTVQDRRLVKLNYPGTHKTLYTAQSPVHAITYLQPLSNLSPTPPRRFPWPKVPKPDLLPSLLHRTSRIFRAGRSKLNS